MRIGAGGSYKPGNPFSTDFAICSHAGEPVLNVKWLPAGYLLHSAVHFGTFRRYPSCAGQPQSSRESESGVESLHPET